jgi:hypothetical protein
MGNTYITGNYLMHPPANTKAVTLSGRTYATPNGTPITVNDYDAHVLEANGWINSGLTGTTANRPVKPPVGTEYIDSSLSLAIFWDGANWRNRVTGASV